MPLNFLMEVKMRHASMRARQMKVWGGPAGANNRRIIIAATSQMDAVVQVKTVCKTFTRYEFLNYWSETGNPVEIEAARDCPRVPLISAVDTPASKDDYVPYGPAMEVNS